MNGMPAVPVETLAIGTGTTRRAGRTTWAALLAAALFLLPDGAALAGTSPGQWTWVSGADTVRQYGTYGTLETPEALNTPGARDGACSWTDGSGNLWLFGGSGYAASASGYLNDLWKFDRDLGQWAWMGGLSTSNGAGTKGTAGQGDTTYIPRARSNAAYWRDADGNFWLFGGWTWGSSPSTYVVDDLWKLEPTTLKWTWVSGSDAYSSRGAVKGSKGESGPTFTPGPRWQAGATTDASGNFWLYGGMSTFFFEGDLWKYDVTLGQWAWWGGTTGAQSDPVYSGSSAQPGSRADAALWGDSGGGLWLFGGMNQKSSTNYLYNDVWKWDGTAWTWKGGTQSTNRTGVYGTQGTGASGNVPGGRKAFAAWKDSSENLWLMGGFGYGTSGSIGVLNDVWKWDGAYWTWVSGSNTINQLGVYGTKGTAATGNVPGARTSPNAWIDSTGSIWLFGGSGYGSVSNNNAWDLNDLWVYGTPPCTIPATPTATNDGPKCEGGEVQLSTPTRAGATYAWTGQGFTSSEQNPKLSNVTSLMAGTYSVTVTVDGCKSAAGSTTVVVGTPLAMPTATNTGPYCVGTTISLQTTAVAGATYAWAGPDGNGSTQQNWTRTSSTLAMKGTYSLTISKNGCTSPEGTTYVTVYPIPSPPTAGNEGPVASGGRIELQASDVVGGTYSWTGPNSFTSSDQNPSIQNATMAMAGTYSVKVTVNGCTSTGSGTTTVSVLPAPDKWTWVSGEKTANAQGAYISVGAAGIPGARWGSVSSTDPTGNLWLFGGQGIDGIAKTGLLNDLWQWNGLKWIWMSGSSTMDPLTRTNVYPGGRAGSVGWIDSGGVVWLFGGIGGSDNCPVATPCLMNELWKWLGPGSQWQFVSGTQGAGNAPYGTYGTKGVEAAGNVPGARQDAVGWIDSDGNLWLFGGFGNAASSQGLLNDLWKWSQTTSRWTWVAGSNAPDAGGTYGTKGTADLLNTPGSRYSAASAKDASGTFWLFGGFGHSADGTSGDLNDLWKWDGTAWTWVSGSNGTHQAGTYGTEGLASAGNVPGARRYSISWVDLKGNFWFLGGYGYSATWFGELNDLWKWDGATWTWVSGSDVPVQPGTYGTLKVGAPGNVPGARKRPVPWSDASGNLWLYGGSGWDSLGALGYLNDLWVYGAPSCTTPATPVPSNDGPRCTEGGTIQLSVPTVRRATYAWTGPGTWSSTEQNPVLSNVTAATSGTYSVNVKVDGCTSAAGTTLVSVGSIPAPTAGNTGPYCTGGTILLVASPVNGATYSWTGPEGFTSASQNPTILGATTAMTGTYSVTATVGGCTSAAGTTAVVVKEGPATPVVSAPPTAREGQPGLVASVPSVADLSYLWMITNGWITAGQGTASIVFTSGSAGQTALSIVETNGAGCTSAAGTGLVTVTPSVGQKAYILTACRLIDTRDISPPSLAPGEDRRVLIAGTCGVPATAKAAILNVTVVGPTAEGSLTMFPGGPTDVPPVASMISFMPGQTRASNGIILLGTDGRLGIFNGSLGSTHVIVDVSGFFQ